MKLNKDLAFATGSSIIVKACQICQNRDLKPIIFLGYMPPVNKMVDVGTQPSEQPSYPAQVLYCPKCHLVQLGLIVDPQILFPKEYPYTSGTTKILKDNFRDLYAESSRIINLEKNDLVVDIGSNDGTLLENYKNNCNVLGVTPEDIGKIAIQKGVPTILSYFNKKTADNILKKYGKAKIITAANVFAHMENIHEILDQIIKLLKPDGVFISESHYLYPLLKRVQYDTIYHEHLRYYSLASLKYLLKMHHLEVFHVKNIPSHGGSIRVYAARKGKYNIHKTVAKQLLEEKDTVANINSLKKFRDNVILSKLKLYNLLNKIKSKSKTIYGISAPSRASTLINFTGLDEGIIDCVLEVKGSYKIGKYIPGTLIPILEEGKLFEDQPDYALLLSWHIADELMPKLVQKGFRGDFIVPLPYPRIVKSIK